MPDYVPGVSTGGPPPAWIGTLKTAIRALDPRTVWDLSVQLGYVAMDLGIRATSWTNDEVDKAIKTAIKSVKQAVAAQARARREIDGLPAEARTEFDATWRGRSAPLMEKLATWILYLQDAVLNRLHGGSAQFRSGLQGLQGELQGLEQQRAWQFSGVFGAGPAVVAAPAAGVVAGGAITSWSIVALCAAVIAICTMFTLNADGVFQTAHAVMRTRFVASLPDAVRNDPDALRGALEQYDEGRPSTLSDALEALAKALPWVAGAGIVGGGVKVWLDWRRDRRLDRVDERLVRGVESST